MNRERRKKLTIAFEKIDEIKDIIEAVKSEEEESLENLPEISDTEKRERRCQGISRCSTKYTGTLLMRKAL